MPAPALLISDLLGIDEAKVEAARREIIRLGDEAVAPILQAVEHWPDEEILIRVLLDLRESGRQAAARMAAERGATARMVFRSAHALLPPFVEVLPSALRVLESGDSEMRFAALDWLKFNFARLLAWSRDTHRFVEPLKTLLERLRGSASERWLAMLDETLAVIPRDPITTVEVLDEAALSALLQRNAEEGPIGEIARYEIFQARDRAWVPIIERALAGRASGNLFTELAGLLASIVENTGDPDARRVLITQFHRPKLKPLDRHGLLVHAAGAKLHEVAPQVTAWMAEHPRWDESAARFFAATGSPEGTDFLIDRMRTHWERDAFYFVGALGAIATPAALVALREAAEKDINSRKSGPWRSWYWALWELARVGTADDLAFIRAQFPRKPKFAAEPLVQALARHPQPAAFSQAVQAAGLLADPRIEARRSLAWAFVYFDAIDALRAPPVEEIARQLATEQTFPRQKSAMQRFLRRHYPEFTSGRVA